MQSKGLRAFSFIISVIFFSLSIGTPSSIEAYGQTPPFNIVKPSTTGVTGEEVRNMRFDPAGNLWIATRAPFWGESAIAMLSADQLPYEPLPGGGFDTGAWRVWSSVQHPIPSAYLNDMEFSADGTMWLSSDGGLTRFRPNAGTPQEMWHTFNTSNSPLLIDAVGSVAIDSQGVIWMMNVSPQQTRGIFKYDPATNQWTQVTVQPPGGPAYLPASLNIGNNDRILVGLWFQPGFAEFDGNAWAIHAVSPGPPLGGLMQDARGDIWAIGDNSNGLVKWNGSAFIKWPTIGGTATMTGLGKDRNGVVYVSTWNGGVYKMINDTPVLFVNAAGIPRNVIGRPNGEVWISNYGGTGVIGTVRHYTEDGQLLERFNNYNAGLGDYFVRRITSDSLGNMWFASGEAGLVRMLGSDGASTSTTHWRAWGNHNDGAEPYPWGGNEPMYCVFEDTDGIYWMGGNGIGRWDSNTGTFTNFWNWQNSTIDTSGIEDLVKRNGTIWAGSGGSGAFWLNTATNEWVRVQLHTGAYSYGPNNVKGMAVDTLGNLWIASEVGLRKFEPGNNSTYTLYNNLNSGLPPRTLYDVEADPAGGIWVATGDGVVRYDGTTWTLYNQANTGMPGTFVNDVAIRASDRMVAIASTQSGTGGVSTFDGQTWTHYTTQNSRLTHHQVVAVEFDRNGNLWASAYSEGVVQIMIGNGARRTAFDFDGDSKSDVSIFRPSNGQWWWQRSSDNVAASATFGTSTDRVVPADFTGDGKTDVAVFRPETGSWYILRSEDGTFYTFPFGTSGDIPAPADYDGDGKADVAVFRPSSGTWYIQQSTAGFRAVNFGMSGDRPVAGDYDGDGKADVAVFRGGTWYIQRSTAGFTGFAFGTSSDVVVPADYDGDGKTDAAVFRSGTWYLMRSTAGFAAIPFGVSTDIPAPADYDGDGKADVSVFRNGTWYLNRTTSGFTAVAFGSSGDTPVPSAFVQ